MTDNNDLFELAKQKEQSIKIKDFAKIYEKVQENDACQIKLK